MSASLPDFALFITAFAVAIATPGPFAAALVARAIAFGFPVPPAWPWVGWLATWCS